MEFKWSVKSVRNCLHNGLTWYVIDLRSFEIVHCLDIYVYRLRFYDTAAVVLKSLTKMRAIPATPSLGLLLCLLFTSKSVLNHSAPNGSRRCSR